MSETINPYQSPSESFEPGYYAFDFARARWREIWRSTGSQREFWSVVASKLFCLPYITAIHNLNSVSFCTLEEVPEQILDRTREFVGQWHRHDFNVNLAHTRPGTLTPALWSLCALSPDSKTLATMACHESASVEPITLSFGSRTKKTRILTTNIAFSFGTPSFLSTVDLLNATLEQLWKRHQERLNAESHDMIVSYTPETQKSAIIEHQYDLGRYHRDRGLIFRLTDEQIAATMLAQ